MIILIKVQMGGKTYYFLKQDKNTHACESRSPQLLYSILSTNGSQQHANPIPGLFLQVLIQSGTAPLTSYMLRFRMHLPGKSSSKAQPLLLHFPQAHPSWSYRFRTPPVFRRNYNFEVLHWQMLRNTDQKNTGCIFVPLFLFFPVWPIYSLILPSLFPSLSPSIPTLLFYDATPFHLTQLSPLQNLFCLQQAGRTELYFENIISHTTGFSVTTAKQQATNKMQGFVRNKNIKGVILS